ncbi:MAG: ABC transporter substrate-binding protein [Candidatus Eremiobacteraeota bacterium]|nr:ABC transporter substrate-binding protein [Candidatus Eremiobacteraeota bacterium]
MFKRRQLLGLIMIILFLFVCLLGCTRREGPPQVSPTPASPTKETPKEKGVIRIGWIGVLTGDAAYYGEMVKYGTELAVDEINTAGGIRGKKIEVIYDNDQLDPKKGVSIITKLITIDKVPLVIQGTGSSVMLACAPIAEKHKVVYISPTCSNDKIKDAGNYIFRNWPSDNYQGKVVADFAFRELGLKKAAILFINNDYGAGLKNVFSRQFKNLGGKVLAVEGFDQGATDFRAQLAKIKNSGAGVVFLSSQYKEGALILKQTKEIGLKVKFVAPEGCFAPELIKLSGGAAEGVYVVNMHWAPDSDDPIVKDFVTKFKKKFKKDPEVYAATAYDCMKIVGKALEMDGETGEGLKDALYKIKDFQGVTGSTTFDVYGEVTKKYDVYVVKNGKFTLFEEE